MTRRLATLLAVASVAWPLMLLAAAWPRSEGAPASWRAVVYLAASRVCHQLPERSFHTAGVQWPVCGRCSGLYLAAPVGALAAVLLPGRRRRLGRAALVGLAVAALPTAAALVLEHVARLPVGNVARMVTAVPLGAAVAFVVVAAAGESPGAMGYTQRP